MKATKSNSDAINPINTSANKKTLGQYFTPSHIATFMASLFSESESNRTIKLLDPGSGLGSLTHAFLKKHTNHSAISLTAVEVDAELIPALTTDLGIYQLAEANIIQGDYLDFSLAPTFDNPYKFTHIIANPPYKKINSQSSERKKLKTLGLDAVNLYAAFILIAINQLELNGELVAIIPRSFCNGPYYKALRELINKQASIDHIHLFSSRNQAFKHDKVLQENVIIKLSNKKQGSMVNISTSSDDTLSDYEEQFYPFNKVVFKNDPDLFIHIPTDGEDLEQKLIELGATYTLNDLKLKVSTGPVVDFRVREYLADQPMEGYVPLLYPLHFNNFKIHWPKDNSKKPNAILIDEQSKKWLYSSGFYCVVKRFSSKEEKKRITPNLVEPQHFSHYDYLGFENHLNVYHSGKVGLDEFIAKGLTIYLSSSLIDSVFRKFNGHTQVNVSDLKKLTYPSYDNLKKLGLHFDQFEFNNQKQIDNLIQRILKE